MASWSSCRIDRRQKLKYSIHLQLTTAGQNTTPHCRSALSLTTHNLHFPSFLLLMHKLWISCYSWGLAHLHTFKVKNVGQGDELECHRRTQNLTGLPVCCLGSIQYRESNILGGIIYLKNKSLGNTLRCFWRFFDVGLPRFENCSGRSLGQPSCSFDRIFPDCSPNYTGVLFALLALPRAAKAARKAVTRDFGDCWRQLCRFILTVKPRGSRWKGEKQWEHQQPQPGRNSLCYFEPLEHRRQLSFMMLEPLGLTLVQIFTHLCVWQCFSSTAASQPLQVLIQWLTGVVAPGIHCFRITDRWCVCVLNFSSCLSFLNLNLCFHHNHLKPCQSFSLLLIHLVQLQVWCNAFIFFFFKV